MGNIFMSKRFISFALTLGSCVSFIIVSGQGVVSGQNASDDDYCAYIAVTASQCAGCCGNRYHECLSNTCHINLNQWNFAQKNSCTEKCANADNACAQDCNVAFSNTSI